jgi:hypothetical protein
MLSFLAAACFALQGGVTAAVPPPAPPPAAGPSALSGPIAVLPVENLSGIEAPLDPVQAALRIALQDRGFELLADEPLAEFMRRQRLRYVGGLSAEMGDALRTETGATSVLITSIDLYQQADPPRFALTARLVTAGGEPRIVWMDSAAASGDEKPGFLGLGVIDDVMVLENRIVGRLGDSLASALSGNAPAAAEDASSGARRFRPRTLYRAGPGDLLAPLPAAEASEAERGTPAAPHPDRVRIAVLPFANDSTARNAGDLLTLQMVRHARTAPGVEVIEPGVVREALLRAHLIQEEGLSLPQADLVRLLLEADQVLFGEVTVYVEAWAGSPEPEVDFSARALSTRTRQVACAAISHGRGDDGAWFFGLRRVPTAHDLASLLTRGFVEGCLVPGEEERR